MAWIKDRRIFKEEKIGNVWFEGLRKERKSCTGCNRWKSVGGKGEE